MIKLIIKITTMLLTLIVSAQAVNKTIQIDIRGRDCIGGSGLCSTSSSSNKNNTMKLYNTIKVSATEIIFEIDNNNLSAEDQKMFYGKEYSKVTTDEQLMFIQEQDFLFDITTLIYLDLDINYPLIKRGTYPIKVIDNKVQVKITLSKKQ
jgi:hypothetical protein